MKEVYGTSFTSSYNTSKDSERQLDYYLAQGVTTSNYSGTIKLLNGSNIEWRLRAADSDHNSTFYYVYSGRGGWGYADAIQAYGVSPAFRIA